ncbi:MAG TPA: VOC family protein [Casimicrobiaceae bacterium]|nr:VOC family protein [Casimicrobiaceae bacterium]
MTRSKLRAAPVGWHSVTPRIVVRDARRLVDFVSYVFGATGAFQSMAPSILQIGDSKLMISEAGERDPHTAFLYVYVSDVTAAYRRAVEHGAHSIEPPLDTPYGDHRCMVEDSWGNTWQIASQRPPDGI